MKSATEQQIFINIEKKIRSIRERMNRLLYNSPITFDQWLILDQIAQDQGISQLKISKNVGKDEASVSRMVKKLKTNQLVVAKKSTENAKFLKLYLSPDGLELVQNMMPQINNIYQRIFGRIHEREMHIFEEILNRMKIEEN